MKAITQAQLNDILYSHYNEDEISASRVTELINEKADDFAISFAEWFDGLRVDNYLLYKTRSIKESLEDYKKQLHL